MGWLIAKAHEQAFLLPWPKHFGVVYMAFSALVLASGFFLGGIILLIFI